MKITTITIVFLMFTSFAFSQNDCQELLKSCDKLLLDGVFRITETHSESSFNQSTARLFKMSTSEIRNYIRSGNNTLGIPIPLAEGVLNFKMSVSNASNRYKNIEKHYINQSYNSISSNNKKWFYKKVADTTLLSAWSKCQDRYLKCLPHTRFPYSIIQHNDSTFTLNIVYKKLDGHAPEYAEISYLSSHGIRFLQDTNIKKNSIIRQFEGLSQKIRRTAKNPSIIIHFKGFPSITISFPKKSIPQIILTKEEAFKDFVGSWNEFKLEFFDNNSGDYKPATVKFYTTNYSFSSLNNSMYLNINYKNIREQKYEFYIITNISETNLTVSEIRNDLRVPNSSTVFQYEFNNGILTLSNNMYRTYLRKTTEQQGFDFNSHSRFKH